MIHEFLIQHAKKNTVSFHMPGHKGAGIYSRYGYGEFLNHLMDCDITEIPGADNLFQAEGIIQATQDRYKKLYNVEQSYLLINGTSGGLIAAILASVRPGGKLIMARNCHKAVFNALTLGNIQPIYAYPEPVAGYGIAGPVTLAEIDRLLNANPEAEAVILPSPNYYGICSAVSAIAQRVHEAGKALIIDQAHGAHLHFFHEYGAGTGMPIAAEDAGADIIVNSTHKTLASFTQSAVLNLNSHRVNRYQLEDRLQMIQSTSPSYLLMGSLDVNAALLEAHGPELINNWATQLDGFYQDAADIPGLQLMITPNLDRTKINLDMSHLGIDGKTLEIALNQREIYPELFTGNILMCMTGIGNTKAHMDQLLDALSQISEVADQGNLSDKSQDRTAHTAREHAKSHVLPEQGKFIGVPEQKEYIALENAKDQICAASVIPYPPGIPLICPGEAFTEEIVQYIKTLRKSGEKVIGVTDTERVLVGKNSGRMHPPIDKPPNPQV